MIIYIVLIILFLYVWYKFAEKKLFNHNNAISNIPVEYGFPILGIIPYIRNEPMHVYLLKLSLKYGPMYYVRVGLRNILVINNYESMKTCFKNHNEAFSARWNTALRKISMRNSGIIFNDGKIWSRHRSFLLKTFRDFGMGKSRTVYIVQKECSVLIDELSNSAGQIVDFEKIIAIYTTNIICQFMMNKRFNRNDSIVKMMQSAFGPLLHKTDPTRFILLMFPQLKFNEPVCKFLYYWFGRKNTFDKINDYLKSEIDEHEKELLERKDKTAIDFIDSFLLERQQLSDKDTSFTDWQLIQSMSELFAAGYDTTSTTLCWAILLLAQYPSVQRQVQNEIETQIGNEYNMVDMADKLKLPYTQAVLDEIMRFSTVAPLAIIHRVWYDVTLDDNVVPKDTLVLPNLYACHHDSKAWENPMTFFPDHFLNEKKEYKPREELVPFGMGKRQCLGESLAKMELFIFFVTIFQRFTVELEEKLTEEQFHNALIGTTSLIRQCPFKRFIFRLK